MGGMARCGINNCGLAKSDFAEIEFHRIPEASLYGLEIGRYGVRVQEEYGHGHVPGSMMVPYDESSAKEVDFDPTDDNLDLPESLQLRQNGSSGRLDERVTDPQRLPGIDGGLHACRIEQQMTSFSPDPLQSEKP